MSWLIIEIWRAIQDTRRARQEEAWQDKLIDLSAEKKISRIQTNLTKYRSRLTEAEAELQKVKAGYIWSRVPTEEDRNNGHSGASEEGTGKAKAGKHSRS
jgi:hypothetical protein